MLPSSPLLSLSFAALPPVPFLVACASAALFRSAFASLPLDFLFFRLPSSAHAPPLQEEAGRPRGSAAVSTLASSFVLSFVFIFSLCCCLRLAQWISSRVTLQKREALPEGPASRRGARRREGTRPEEEEKEKEGREESAAADIPLRVVVVLGSGGHTAEMLHLVRGFNPRFFKLHFLVADSDTNSLRQLTATQWGLPETEARSEGERRNAPDTSGEGNEARALKELMEQRGFGVFRIPRSRDVGQPFFTSIFSSLHALGVSLRLVWTLNPQLVLVNGPGTCVPVAFAALVREFVTGTRFSLIFVESACRVESLSLSGRLLYPFADRVFVQWESLAKKFPKSEFLGSPLY
ncbi:putative glycosyl transferase [Besnoitia besnoiti]|uniref:UDP-N-acetylglucosamine transferase subunit ALG14 n=1 Tax=Besnoitia besnoiti TaxID=94643 RepID=A0A2A9MMR0_BESBE|nr:putative glycosyl transferase [Besnoitia besnoiti]PFH36890.1 putative glycosyl transferase [Besnoitia besnoiti]